MKSTTLGDVLTVRFHNVGTCPKFSVMKGCLERFSNLSLEMGAHGTYIYIFLKREQMIQNHWCTCKTKKDRAKSLIKNKSEDISIT